MTYDPGPLLRALTAAGIDHDRIAQALDVHPSTVDKWTSGRNRPRPAHRVALADLVGLDVAELFPPDDLDASGDAVEIVDAWATMAEVPAEDWADLIRPTTTAVDVLALEVGHVADADPTWWRRVAALGALGATVRVCLGDPQGPTVDQRAADEGIAPAELAARIEAGLGAVRAHLSDAPGVEVRRHDGPLYASWFRADDRALVTPQLWGAPESMAPTLALRRLSDHGLWSSWAASFERVWAAAEGGA